MGMSTGLVFKVLLFVPILFAGTACAAGGNSSQAAQGVICAQDAKMCPDGSYVARTGPHCEMAACPSIKADGNRPGPPPGMALQHRLAD